MIPALAGLAACGGELTAVLGRVCRERGRVRGVESTKKKAPVSEDFFAKSSFFRSFSLKINK